MKNRWPIFTVILILVLVLYHSAIAQTDSLVVKRTNDFEVTGRGSAAAWLSTDWITLAKRKGQAPYATRAKLLYSGAGIYVLFSNDDKEITASFAQDFENLWTEDVVEVFLWTDESESLYFEYELSPLNHELPILVPNFDGRFLGWLPWQYEGERRTRHATHIIKDDGGGIVGWSAEFFIPFSLLRPLRNVPPKSGDRWRANLYRLDYDQEYTSWSWQPVTNNFHDYKNFGVIRFE